MTNRASAEYWNRIHPKEELRIIPNMDPIRAWIETNFHALQKEAKTCIEIGCYPGRFLAVFGELGYELFGVDLVDNLEILPSWLKDMGYKVGTFWKMDIMDFDPNQKFDVVSSFGFMEHFTNWDQILIKHMSLVRKNGFLVLEVPNFIGVFQHWVHLKLDRANLERHYVPAMDIRKWKEILTAGGFDIIYAKYFGKFAFWTADENLTLISKLFVRILKKFRCPLNIILPKDTRIYSPFCGVIARKRD